jgi:predicted NBD/HSP70 family sugar kinase
MVVYFCCLHAKYNHGVKDELMIFKTDMDTNTLLALRCVWLNPRISRTEIAKIIQVDQSTVSRIVGSLLELGIVQTVDEGRAGPQGGRKPVFLRVDPDFGLIVGIELQSEEYTIVGINLIGDILFSVSEKLEQVASPIMPLFFNVLQKAYSLVAATGLELLGIGVGLPGIIDGKHGVIIQSNPLEIREPLPFLDDIAPVLLVPIRIEHDARCCCWAELAFHKGRCPRNFLYVLGEFRRNRLSRSAFKGIALGLGFVFDHRVYTGEDFAAGEFRSVFYDQERFNQHFRIPDEVLERMEGSEEIQKAFADELGRNLAMLINVLNLSMVVIGGSIEKLGSIIPDTIQREVRGNWLYPHQGHMEAVYSQLGENAVAYGAAGMFLEQIFSPPDTNPSVHELVERIETMAAEGARTPDPTDRKGKR